MNIRNKTVLSLVLLAAVSIIGSWFSGFILLKWLGLDKMPLGKDRNS